MRRFLPVVGGHAVAFHGHPRFTGDVDFLVRPSAENGERIVRVLKLFGFGSLGVKAGDFEVKGQLIQKLNAIAARKTIA